MPATISQEFPFSQIPNWVILHPDLTAHDKTVYMVIATHADRQRTAFPGIRRIAAEAGCSTTTVQKAISNLEQVGALVTTRTVDEDGRHLVNHYQLPMVCQLVLQGVAADDTPPVAADDTELYPLSLTTSNELQVAKRDEWWDELVAILGKPSDSKTSLQGKLVARLKRENIPPGEIRVRAERLATHWGAKALTLPALVEHWDWLGSPAAQVTSSQIKQSARARELSEAMEGIE